MKIKCSDNRALTLHTTTFYSAWSTNLNFHFSINFSKKKKQFDNFVLECGAKIDETSFILMMREAHSFLLSLIHTDIYHDQLKIHFTDKNGSLEMG